MVCPKGGEVDCYSAPILCGNQLMNFSMPGCTQNGKTSLVFCQDPTSNEVYPCQDSMLQTCTEKFSQAYGTMICAICACTDGFCAVSQTTCQTRIGCGPSIKGAPSQKIGSDCGGPCLRNPIPCNSTQNGNFALC